MRSLRSLCLGLALAVPCVFAPRVTADRAAQAPYVVAAGDVLEITILAGGERQEQATATVTPDGNVTCPLLGAVRAAGRSVPDLTTELQQRLARDYFQQPRVVVSVKEYGATIAVSGEVRRPGVYRLSEARSALGACVLAGGFTEFASARGARVLRERDGKTVTLRVDLARVRKGAGEDLALEPGDRLEIPRRLL